MSTYTISGASTKTFTFHSPYTTLDVTQTGYLDVPGAVAVDANKGTHAYTIANYGKIAGDVYLGQGGVVSNGSYDVTSASIKGGGEGVFIRNAIGAVVNYGVIEATNAGSTEGAYLALGGTITNGDPTDTTATIRGAYGIFIRNATGTVTNFGTIQGKGFTGGNAAGLYMPAGGKVTNGSATDTSALIEGSGGIDTRSAAATVVNFGSVLAEGKVNGMGVQLGKYSRLTNGSVVDTGALIEGYYAGVSMSVGIGAGTLANLGTIEARAAMADSPGVYLSRGVLTNGTSSDRTALISGYDGVRGDISLTNEGTILGSGVTSYGVELLLGSLANGSPVNTSALIEGGYAGVKMLGAIGSNYGTIESTGVGNAAGLYLNSESGSTSIFTNGAYQAQKALIAGAVGAYLYAGSILENWGVIEGLNSNVAVDLKSSAATLEVEQGSVLEGDALGGGGTLILGSGTGVMAGSVLTAVTISGSMPTAYFFKFGTVEVGKGASFALPATMAVDVGETLSIAGALSGGAAVSISGGALSLDGGASLTVAEVTISAGTASVATTIAYAGKWIESGGILSVASGDSLALKGTLDSFAGTLQGPGAVVLSGTLTIGAAGATIASGAILEMSNAATNTIVGTSGTVTLTNSGKILGAGDLGGGTMTLVNKAGASIIANDTAAMTIDIGTGTLQNAGAIDLTAAGGLTIKSAVANSGVLGVSAGTLLAQGSVTGAGSVRIGGGTADFAKAFTENVAFTATTGVLELTDSQAYTGQVTGFSTSGGTSFDLLDIAFGGTTTASFSGTTTSGTLTVTDGTHTAKITLEGNYTTSIFKVSSDNHGGTTVVDPMKTVAGATPPRSLAQAPQSLFRQALAAFAHGPPGRMPAHMRHDPLLMLAAPRLQRSG